MKVCGIDLHSNNSVIVVSDAEERIVMQLAANTQRAYLLIFTEY